MTYDVLIKNGRIIDGSGMPSFHGDVGVKDGKITDIGNCSLSLAPVRRGREKRMAEFLSYVEAIPMEVLNTVEVDWESFPQYMERLDQHLGVNVGNLIGHSTVRYYVMGDES